MFRAAEQGFIDEAGGVHRYVAAEAIRGTPDWDRRQENSMAEYEQGEAPEGIVTLYKLFDGYIAGAISGRSNLKILDVGCGIGRDWPPYTASIRRSLSPAKNVYVGLDPISMNVTDRKYPFVCSRVEDLRQVLADRFDVFLFSTSLDHFEDVGRVAETIRAVSSDNGIAVFWIGLHDAHIVAAEVGSNVFARLFGRMSFVRFGLRYVLLQLQALRLYYLLWRRQKKLDAGAPLDDLHFQYFTESNVDGALRSFGTVRDLLRIPGTNGLFATVSVDCGR